MSFADILEKLDRSGEAKLAAKLPSWAGVHIEVPSSINLQQCSGEEAALFKSSLVPAGARVADLTGGLGVDSWAFSKRSSAVWYNERDAVLTEAVKRNFAALGVPGVVFNSFDISAEAPAWADALRAFAPDVIYLDPARRDAAGRKVFLLEDCSPDVVSLMPLLLDIASSVIVKVSPMADLTMLQRRLAGWLEAIYVIGVDGECKELLCVCRPDAAFIGVYLAENGFILSASGFTARLLPPKDFASLIPPTPCGAGPSRSRDHGRPRSSEATPASVSPEAAEYPEAAGRAACDQQAADALLFVPSAAMVKSGLGPGMCRIAYDERLAPFGKFYQVIEELPFASSALKELSRRWPQAEVTAKGVQISSEELRKKIRTKPGGPVHIFACALNGERRLIITTLR